MPRKLPVDVSTALAKTATVKKVSRPQSVSRLSANKSSPVPRAEPLRRPRTESSSPVMLLVLIILVVVAIGAYSASVYFKNKSAEEAILADVIKEPIAGADTAEAPIDPTVSWLAFDLPSILTSAATPVAMSFKYPPELTLTQNPDNLILSNDSVTNTQVNIYWVESSKSLNDYLAAMDEVNATGWEGQPSVAITTSTEAVIISGFPAVFRQQKLLAADLNQYIIYIKAADTVLAVGLAAPELDQNLLAFFVTFLNNLQLAVE